jgi:hypothetical protein
MERLVTKVRRAFRARFPNARFRLDKVEIEERLSGLLIWQGFDEFDQVDRQTKVRNVLQRSLTQEEREHVGAILTVTPDELEIIRAG